MGSILKVRTLTTFAEGAILCLGVIVLTAIVYFTMPNGVSKNTTTTDSTSVQLEVVIDSTASPVKDVEVTVTTPVKPNSPTKVAEPLKSTEPIKVKRFTKSTSEAKSTPEAKPKPQKPKQNKNGERENLDINF